MTESIAWGTEDNPSKTKILDDRKFVTNSNAKKIRIDSAIADVHVTCSNSSKIEIHLHGSIDCEDDVDFEIQGDEENDEIRIKLRFAGSCYCSDLQLDVIIPHKFFKLISVKTLSANIVIAKEVLTERIEVKTRHGRVAVDATFRKTEITTFNGNIELYTEAQKDIEVKIVTVSGNIMGEFRRIGQLELLMSKTKGVVRNSHKREAGHAAKVEISTICGDVTIR